MGEEKRSEVKAFAVGQTVRWLTALKGDEYETAADAFTSGKLPRLAVSAGRVVSSSSEQTVVQRRAVDGLTFLRTDKLFTGCDDALGVLRAFSGSLQEAFRRLPLAEDCR